MSAPVLNTAGLIGAGGPVPASGAGGGQAQPGAAAEFGAVLSALFGEPEAVQTSVAAGVIEPANQAAASPEAADANAQGDTDDRDQASDTGEPDPALLAALGFLSQASLTANAAASGAEVAPTAVAGEDVAPSLPVSAALQPGEPEPDLQPATGQVPTPDSAPKAAGPQAPQATATHLTSPPPVASTPPAAPIAEATTPPPIAQAAAAEPLIAAPEPKEHGATPARERGRKAAPPGLQAAAEATSKPGPPTAATNAAPALGDPAGKSVESLAGAPTDQSDPATSSPDGPDSAQGGAETRATGAAQAAAAPPAHTAARGAPETVATLAAKIIKKLDERSTRFDLELDPAGLGRVDVRVDINAHGRISAAMSFDNPQAAAELRARAGELQKALEQAGFDLSGGLSFDMAGERGRSDQGAQEQSSEQAGAAFRGRAFQAALDAAGAADSGAPTGLNLRRSIAAGVDIRI